ncbi:hypothetical protein JJV70_12650 [Streptomyces sp. JJ66]|uniref:hypothetical protein n=1 Tax=Streptomyces sp. JJ66 TaxID=2803843 RepID=UPI001C57AD49|nr:hypothetical protein [Streptomyces sp. JJ66]MBW1602940.1 hypothetical protein [Streptomyces sp. JJ66]
MGEPRRGEGGGRRWRAVAAGVVVLALAGYLVVQYVSTQFGPPRCVVRAQGDGERYELEPEMARNAAAIGAVGSARGLPERAVTIALATAMQESSLRNIDHGDRDSLGLFQQRPSQGWGTPEQIMDPVYAAGKFYEGLVEVPGYTDLPLTVAAQEVQRSGFPDAYAKHEPQAALLTAALTGREAASLTCTGLGTPPAGDPERVRAKLRHEFGADLLAGAEVSGGRSAPGDGDLVIPVPGGGSSPAEGDAASGRAPDPERRGWELAHWSLANASELGIARIAYGGRVWESERSGDGWRTARGTAADEGVRLTLVREPAAS